MFRVSFLREGKEIEVEAGSTVLEAEIRAGLHPDAPCGGAGKCGKCLVKIGSQIQKACQTRVDRDLAVDTLHTGDAQNRILTKGSTRPVVFAPDLRQRKITLTKPAQGDHRSEWERLLQQLELSETDTAPNLELASSLFGKRREQAEWYAVYSGGEVFALNKTEQRICFAAFDIGTTTVAGYLLDAQNGQQLAVCSRMNPQTSYGADVIMRANYAQEHTVEPLCSSVRRTLDEMLGQMTAEAKICREDIYQICVVGNTCMHHFFLGLSADSMVHAPYNPVISRGLTLPAGEYGLHIHGKGQLLMLPTIAAYVGADTCGCLLALRPDQKDEISLMIDIGTNGELVLGNRRQLVCCSTAAGPALEGAKITCGMRGARGAVDHVEYREGKWTYTTIDRAPAAGICGSGLIDLVAELCRTGLLDESGHLNSGQQNSSLFMLVPPEKSADGKGVYLTQKDIGEVQLAKAAIAAGISLLLRALDLTEKDVSRVWIAGAFGNYMNPESAARIGLFPFSFLDRIVPVGNAAGEGAKIALLNKQERGEMETLVKNVRFVELAASPDFQDCFVDELAFPEQEE